jgi:hypothetical protein
MVRTVEISGDQIEVHADIGPGRIVKATIVIDDSPVNVPLKAPIPYAQDPFGKELDELLAMTEPVNHFVDDSREAIYTPDEQIIRENNQ